MLVELCRRVAEKLDLDPAAWSPDIDTSVREPRSTAMIPGSRIRYLAEIAEQGREINRHVDTQAEVASRLQHLYESLKALDDEALPAEFEPYKQEALTASGDRSLEVLRQRYQQTLDELSPESIRLLREWPARRESVTADTYSYEVRGREIRGDNYRESLSHQKIPKIAARTS